MTHFFLYNYLVSPIYYFLGFLFCFRIFKVNLFDMYECFLCTHVSYVTCAMEVRKRVLDPLDMEL